MRLPAIAGIALTALAACGYAIQRGTPDRVASPPPATAAQELRLPTASDVAPKAAATSGDGLSSGPRQDPAPVHSYEVVRRYPHDPDAFTQGLEYVDGTLYEGTGLYGESTLRRVELETGTVLQSVPLASRYFGEGITIWDERIIQITWRERTAFVYSLDTFTTTGAFTYDTEGWGLTHDDTRLIMSDGTSRLTFRDPDTFEGIGFVDVHDAGRPIVHLNELEYINGEVWANIWLTDHIVIIDPETGAVNATVDLAGLLPAEDRTTDSDVLNGIAYDAAGDRLFLTGKKWPVLFEVKLVPPRTSAISPALLPFAITTNS